jgi:hypothetical protein
MVNFRNLVALATASPFLGSVLAHPGEVHTAEQVKREVTQHKAAQVKARRALSECANSQSSQALKARAVARRAATAQALRDARGITTSKLIKKPPRS